jgi:glycosyltransferase involved in cell wall biosynthesis
MIRGEVKVCRILMFGSLPLAAPWNGADKNLARLLVLDDRDNQFIIQTSIDEQWPLPPKVTAVRKRSVNSVPTLTQKLAAFTYLLGHTHQADLIHVVASLKKPDLWRAHLLRAWPALHRKPIVHTVPSIGDRPVQRHYLPGDTTIVVSEHTKRLLIHEGVQNVIRIYPPVDVQHLQPITQPAEVAQALQLGSCAVLYPAHYGPQSGISEMIQAFARLSSTLRDAVLVLACRTHPGHDPQVEAERVRVQAAEAGIAERIRILDAVDDMPALIAACAVTALVPGKLASKMDLPLVLLESLMLERPIIVTDTPPINEALLGGGGIAVPYGDVAALTAALTRLLSSPPVWEKLGKQGRKAVLEQCQPNRVIQRYQEIYQSTLERWGNHFHAASSKG